VTTADPTKADATKADPTLAAPATRPEALPRVDLLQRRMAADLYRQGSWHLVRGQYGVAAERMREALEHDPDLLEARHDLAGIFYRQQNYDRALAEYQSVLDRNANYESALYGAALAYVAKRDYDRSREMLTRLLKINDRNAEAWLDLGDVLFMTGDVINAQANWRQAMKLDPSAKEVIAKAQRRLELYGPSDELSSAKQEK
jgi:tetratricopeptide (TPR) repeat protein